LVDDHLACIGAANIFAFGDCATAVDPHGRPLWPPTAQLAHQQAAWLARTLSPCGRAPPSFRYRSMGTLVSLGEGDAAAEFPALREGGFKPSFDGAIAKLLYISLYHMHRITLYGPARAAALALADALRRTTFPPVKLH
jgi:NADH dehydrogenase